MKVRWLKSALVSLVEIHDYIAAENPEAAERVRKKVRYSTERLKIFPLSGRTGVVPGTREVVISGLPYIVQYRVVGREVHILRVYHAKRQIM